MRHAGAGLGLTALVAGGSWVVWGAMGGVAAGSFGLIATAVHVVAVRLLEPVLTPPFERVPKRWVMGLGLRLAGAVLLAGAMYGLPGRFPPLPSALGFLGVLVPLLFGEMQLLLRAMRGTRERP